MYAQILVPVDNSVYSHQAVRAAIALARSFDSQLTGIHVYASDLHAQRFQLMEKGLPPRFQQQGKLQELRQTHNSLIYQGLELIAQSYLDAFAAQCLEAQVPYQLKAVRGKNYEELIREADSQDYDLIVLGALGLGVVARSIVGSVCERVARGARADVLVVRGDNPLAHKVVVGIDGSPNSYTALKAGLALSQANGGKLQAVAVYDPYFHKTVFKSLVGVLSEEMGKLFHFREQERLHDEVIDKGLEKVYLSYLDEAQRQAEAMGAEIETRLLRGKPFDEMVKFVEDHQASLVVVGRYGAHATDHLDIGSTAENLLRLLPCHLLISNQKKKSYAEVQSIAQI